MLILVVVILQAQTLLLKHTSRAPSPLVRERGWLCFFWSSIKDWWLCRRSRAVPCHYLMFVRVWVGDTASCELRSARRRWRRRRRRRRWRCRVGRGGGMTQIISDHCFEKVGSERKFEAAACLLFFSPPLTAMRIFSKLSFFLFLREIFI